MKGMRLLSDTPSIFSKRKLSETDLAVFWSWKQPEIAAAIIDSGRHVLVMERGFLQPRNEWVSLAIDGFNNRGKFAPAPDGGARWQRLFAHHLKPWRSGGDYALLIGQVPGDAALNGTDIVAWAATQAQKLIDLGHKVVYRPHPEGPTPCPPGASLSTRSLVDDLAGAERVVTYNSTTAVEAILAGIPTVVSDEGTVAYPMCSHQLEAPLARPDRSAWCHDIAWRQWSIDELADGTAWSHVRRLVA